MSIVVSEQLVSRVAWSARVDQSSRLIGEVRCADIPNLLCRFGGLIDVAQQCHLQQLNALSTCDD
jgi:hypothetical protein